MKRFLRNILILFMTCLLALSGACSSQAESEKPDKSLYEHGLEMISLMKEMASSDEYITLLSGGDSIKSILLEAGQGDFSHPKAVYRIKISETAFLSLLEASMNELPSSLQETLKSKVASVVFNQINALGGAEAIAASSVCMGEKVFVSHELQENEIYLYTYEDAVPVAVIFTAGEDGAVSATGMFVLYDDFEADTISSIERQLIGFGAEVEEITP